MICQSTDCRSQDCTEWILKCTFTKSATSAGMIGVPILTIYNLLLPIDITLDIYQNYVAVDGGGKQVSSSLRFVHHGRIFCLTKLKNCQYINYHKICRKLSDIINKLCSKIELKLHLRPQGNIMKCYYFLQSCWISFFRIIIGWKLVPKFIRRVAFKARTDSLAVRPISRVIQKSYICIFIWVELLLNDFLSNKYFCQNECSWNYIQW